MVCSEAGSGFALDIGVNWEGVSPFEPDYVLPLPELQPEFASAAFVHYLRAQRIRVIRGRSLGQIYDPLFNRTHEHFFGHQHAPPREAPSGYDCGVMSESLIYLAHPSFTAYRAYGHLTCRRYVARCLRLLLGKDDLIQTNLPSAARLSLTHQEEENRWVVHLLYAPTHNRGGRLSLDTGSVQSSGCGVEIIEELPPLRDIAVAVRLDVPIIHVSLEPQGVPLEFHTEKGYVRFIVPECNCHQMVVLQA